MFSHFSSCTTLLISSASPDVIRPKCRVAGFTSLVGVMLGYLIWLMGVVLSWAFVLGRAVAPSPPSSTCSIHVIAYRSRIFPYHLFFFFLSSSPSLNLVSPQVVQTCETVVPWCRAFWAGIVSVCVALRLSEVVASHITSESCSCRTLSGAASPRS